MILTIISSYFYIRFSVCSHKYKKVDYRFALKIWFHLAMDDHHLFYIFLWMIAT
jgi:hypothetical protein